MPPETRFLTTGQVASHCGVNFRTVIRWIKKGYLPAHRLPGRGDHRISWNDFVEFLQKNQFQMPISSEEKTPASTPHPPQSHLTPRVLIVEDDASVAHSIQRVLKLNGYETTIASDGFEAGIKLEEFNPSLMTLDLLMPGIDGLTVLSTLRSSKKWANLPVLIISGDSDEKSSSALSQGAQGFLKKPYSNAELMGSIKTILSKNKSE